MTTSPKAVTFVTADHDKGQHAVGIFRARLNDAKLSEEEMQRVNDSSVFAAGLDELFAKARVLNDFAGEEVKPAYGYPNGYAIRTVPQQIATLLEIFPGLDATQALELAKRLPKKLPYGTEGYFALPKVSAIARIFFADVEDEAEQYVRAVNLILDKIAEQRSFHNYRSGQITKERLRQRVKDREKLLAVEASQPGDIIVIAGQFGQKYGGKSVRRVRVLITGTEFGLGAFHVGCMVLTHPKRLQKREELDLDCPGDEFDESDSDDRFARAPVFRYLDDKVKFGTIVVSRARDYYGSVSGFPPQ